MALTPMAMYGLEVPPGDVALSARPDIPSAFRITMAALDPSAEPEGDEGAVPRATLKVIRQSLLADDDDDDFDEDDFDQEAMERMLAEDYSDEDSGESSDDEAVNGGPSDPAKTKKARKEAAKLDIQKLLQEADGMEVDDESGDDDAMPNGVNGIAKSKKALGKMPAGDDDDDDDDDDEDSEMDEDFVEEYVICTLDPTKLYQQPLDLTFGEDEKVWFKVSGTHSIYLTGNYVEPAGAAAPGLFDPDSDEEEDYDLEPDMDELEDSDDDDDSIEDELDDIENPRITEIDADEEVPTLVSSKKGKALANKNKRPAVDSDDEDAKLGVDGLDAMITEAKLKAEPTVKGDKKLSKQERKKLKKNDGAAGAPPLVEKVEKIEVDVPPSSASNKSDKKVSFAKELEQGPTPTPTKDAKDAKSNDKTKGPALGVKTVQGVTLDDKKLGSGQAAKNGDRVSMRYIGKLQSDGSVFDSNKKGKPFSFKLGAKEVIQGWEIGVQGMQAGGERRITIPAHLAYGSKKLPGIPPNSTLVFDIKVLEVGKK